MLRNRLLVMTFLLILYFQANTILGNLDGFQRVQVTGIRCGSVILEFDAIFDADSRTTMSDVAKEIRAPALLGENGHIGSGIYIPVFIDGLNRPGIT